MGRSKSPTSYKRRKGIRNPDGTINTAGDSTETAAPRYEKGRLRSLRSAEGRLSKWVNK